MDQEHFRHDGCRIIDALKFKRYIHSDSLLGLSCNGCLSEWLQKNLLPQNNLGEELMHIDGNQLRLLKKPDVDVSTFHIEPNVTEIRNLRNLSEYLVPGDHIKYKWFASFSHHAIVKAVTANSITLIHWYGGNNGSVQGKVMARVVEKEIHNMAEKYNVIYRFDYNDGIVTEDSKILTIARANAWLGESGYLLLTKNCEHFAVFCKIGRHWSFQSERLTKSVTIFIREALQKVGITVGFEAFCSALEIVASQSKEISALAPMMQTIGLGLVIVVQGVFCLLDIRALYRNRNDNVEDEEFVGRIWHIVYKRLEKVFFTGVVPAGCVVTLGALLPGCAVVTAVSILVGAICAGVLSIPWGYNGEVPLGGHMVSNLVRTLIFHRDHEVAQIRDLSHGDHVVLYRWFLHPRCHMIVTNVDISSDTLNIIRFAYQRGVVEEKLKFHTPMYKVVHNTTFPADVVIRRARKANFPAQAYNIFTFNCKHFAFWCETNTVPAEP